MVSCRAFSHAHSLSAAATSDASQEASGQLELPQRGREGRGRALPSHPLASAEQLVPASCSRFQSTVGKEVSWTPYSQRTSVPRTPQSPFATCRCRRGGGELAGLRAEKRAAENRRADFAWVNGELLLLGAAHGWQRGRANGHQCRRELCQNA